MEFCDHGIVINSRPLRENDRIVTVFSRTEGKFEVNFKSVRLAKAKLRALSLPVSRGEYRFFLKKGSNFPICTGGHTSTVYPGLRSNIPALNMAFHFCELVNRLTPAWQPAEMKYFLLSGTLDNLEQYGVSFWIRRAFTLRLLDLAGFGFRETAAGLDDVLWQTLHEAPWQTVRELPEDRYAAGYTDSLIQRFLDNTGIQLNTLQFVK
ncbi:MAG: DNA repair protein RecO [Elusimicrobiales bacterium]|nr:DNA repair protein RecO [Elusimicrobiales bacterium]